MTSRLSSRVLILAALASGLAAAVLFLRPAPSFALPAYAAATGQVCATCHVNPAGGGVRTAVGQSFEAIPSHVSDPVGAFAQATAGASSAMPILLSPAPSRTGQQVYEGSCGVCHGMLGQGKLGVPTLAGAAGHMQRLGINPQDAAAGLTPILRNGVSGRMPPFPPAALSDADIASLANYLMTLPPATGDSLYTAQCATCHGLAGEGVIGHPLNSSGDFVKPGITVDQLAVDLGKTVRAGIPGEMPSFPQLTDLEVRRLAVHLLDFDQVSAWAAEFKAKEGHDPTIADWNDRAWSLEFVARFGRQPTDAEWAAHWAETNPNDEM